MNIGEVAKKTGLTTKSIRFYEQKGLITPVRLENAYRSYQQYHVTLLTLISRARGVGFTLDECRDLVTLFERKDKTSFDVKSRTQSKVDDIQEKIDELVIMKSTLLQWMSACPGDESSNCPIIDNLTEPLGDKK